MLITIPALNCSLRSINVSGILEIHFYILIYSVVVVTTFHVLFMCLSQSQTICLQMKYDTSFLVRVPIEDEIDRYWQLNADSNTDVDMLNSLNVYKIT